MEKLNAAVSARPDPREFSTARKNAVKRSSVRKDIQTDPVYAAKIGTIITRRQRKPVPGYNLALALVLVRYS